MKSAWIVLFVALGSLLLTACLHTPTPVWVERGYYLVWGDEFEGGILDTSRWKTHTNNPAPYDRVPPRSSCNYDGAEIFLDENVSVDNGRLLLRTAKGPYLYSGVTGGTCGVQDACGFVGCDSFHLDLDFTSGSVSSKVNFNFGYFEARVKITPGKGLYPVFWLWHHDELVVFEFFGDPSTQYVSMHRGEVYISEKFNQVKDYSDAFHLYAIEWTPLWVKWYFDGELIKEEPGQNPAFPDGENRWMGLNLSVNVYEWLRPDSTTSFPTFMEVDYVRVYQLAPKTEK